MRNNASRVCAWCGTRYPEWKVGLTFRDVRRELGAGARTRHGDDRRYVTRRTVLGRMHEHKINLWFEYHGPGRCEAAPVGAAGDPSDLASLPALPF